MTLIVQKYGGTSVGNIDRITWVANNIANTLKSGVKLLVVVSAMSGDTDRLLNLAQQIAKTTKSRELDNLVATGEQITISLLSLALQNLNIKSRCYCGWQIPIITTDNFSEARIKHIDTNKINNDLNSNTVVIIAGFQGVSEHFDITTLGRGGSDTSAVALAIVTNATECQIYTDVNGVYNADPNKVTNARRIDKINGALMFEASSLGTKVLHVRSCELAYRYKTNIRVLSTFAPQDQGSLIMNQIELENYPIISLSTNEHQSLCIINLENVAIAINDIVCRLYKISNIDMLNINQKHISFALTELSSNDIKRELNNIAIEHTIINNLTKISLIGSGFRSNRQLNQNIWRILNGTEVFAVSHNEISMSILVHSLDATVARNSLAKLI
ncbi:MAG: aspartate kinase [Burkholderiales bacterium]|nr:aspartate kinase [Burkholderiales bacterium]